MFVGLVNASGNIQEKCSVRFTVSFHAYCAKIKEVTQDIVAVWTRTISEVAFTIFSIHDNFNLDARATERMFILVAA